MTHATTLSDRMFSQRTALTDALLIAGGATLTAVCAQIAIPLWPVPLTLQTLAVLLCGAALGARRGALSQVAYLASGFVGLPVFAHGTAGLLKLAGPTGGYLVGFVFAAYLVGWLAERGWDRGVVRTALAMTAGSLCILTLGALYLSLLVGPAQAWWAGFALFLPGAALKVIAAMLLLPGAWRLVGDGNVRGGL